MRNAHETLAAFRAGTLSPVETTRETLDAIERRNPTINAFQHVDPDRALAAAEASERRWREGAPMGELDGIALAIKDLVRVAGWPTLGGSRSVDPDQAWDEDAPCVARLREAGAVIFGKTTTPEFGWKGLTDGPLFGATRNPWNPALSSGGSSGGAAASLAAGIGIVSHGNDGGGSIRIPASYCGLYGFKPSFGRVPNHPRDGAYATQSSEGPITRTVADAALMMNVLARPDRRDWYALPHDGRDYLDGLEDGVSGLRVALCLDLGGAKPSADIAAAVREAAKVFESLGAHVEAVGQVFPPLRDALERYWLGGLYRRVAAVPSGRRHLLDPDLLRVAAAGADVTLAEYEAGMTARANLGARMNAFHADFDLLLTPTMPADPPPADTVYHTEQFDRWEHATPYTVPFNMTGQPAASIPCGFSAAGMPVGLQIVGDRHADALVLRASRAFERERPIPAINAEGLRRLEAAA